MALKARVVSTSFVLVSLMLSNAVRAEMTMYFIHNDHLGTPQVVTDENQSVVWQADSQPFGEVEIVTNQVEQDARFPGQYIDAQTELLYNYYRDYDPTIGRYIQSDPIGINGGTNTYAYVESSPLNYIDPFGLAKWTGRWEYLDAGIPFTSLGGIVGQIIVTSECVDGKQWYVWLKFSGAGGSGGYPVGLGASRIEMNDPYPTADPLQITGDFTVASGTFASMAGVSTTIMQVGTATSASFGPFIGIDMSWADYHGSVGIEKAVERNCECTE